MSLPKDDKEAKKHWLAQEPSINRPFKSKDPGLVQVDSPADIQTIVSREVSGEVTPVFRARTATEMADPIARSTSMIRNVTQKGMTAEEFLKRCENVEDLTLYSALFEDMAPDKKAAIYLKLSKLLWDKQKEQQKQLNIERNLEDKHVKNMLEIKDKLQKMKKRREQDGDGDK